jgi:hypothetical protein
VHRLLVEALDVFGIGSPLLQLRLRNAKRFQ